MYLRPNVAAQARLSSVASSRLVGLPRNVTPHRCQSVSGLSGALPFAA